MLSYFLQRQCCPTDFHIIKTLCSQFLNNLKVSTFDLFYSLTLTFINFCCTRNPKIGLTQPQMQCNQAFRWGADKNKFRRTAPAEHTVTRVLNLTLIWKVRLEVWTRVSPFVRKSAFDINLITLEIPWNFLGWHSYRRTCIILLQSHSRRNEMHEW